MSKIVFTFSNDGKLFDVGKNNKIMIGLLSRRNLLHFLNEHIATKVNTKSESSTKNLPIKNDIGKKNIKVFKRDWFLVLI